MKRVYWLLIYILLVTSSFGPSSQTRVYAAENSPYSLHAVSIAAGDYHMLAVMSDGTVRAWGKNLTFTYGNGSNMTVNVAMPVYELYQGAYRNLTGIVAVAGGSQYSLALKEDGTVYSWGFNGSKELGRPTLGWFGVAAEQIPGLTDIVQISAGVTHAMALTKDGHVWVWGDNQAGQAGNGGKGNGVFEAVPTQTMKSAGVPLTNIVQIAASGSTSMALTSDGQVLIWGYNGQGQLGDGTYTHRSYPANVTGNDGQAIRDVQQVAMGGNFAMALKTDGTVLAWGDNSRGQLGTGSYTSARRAQQVVNGLGEPFDRVTSLAAGNMFSIAQREDGTLWTWGGNTNWNGTVVTGQLGIYQNITATNVPVQVKVTEEGTPIDDIAMFDGGVYHMAVLKSDGSVWSAGDNTEKQLGGGREEPFLLKLAQISLTAVNNAFWLEIVEPLEAGMQTAVVLQVADYWKRPIKNGTDHVKMETSSGSLGDVTYIGDGKFSAVFEQGETGIAAITATINGVSVPSSHSIKIESSAPYEANSLLTASPHTAIADSSAPIHLKLQLRDEFNNVLTRSGGAVTFTSSIGDISNATETSFGVYEAELRSSETGQAFIGAELDGKPLTLTTRAFFVSGTPESKNSTLQAVNQTLPADGVTSTSVILQLKDAYGNSLTESGGELDWDVNLGELGAIKETSYGVYETVWSSSQTGTGSLTVSRQGELAVQPITVEFVPVINGIEFSVPAYEVKTGETVQTAVNAHYWDGSSSNVTSDSVLALQNKTVADISASGIVTGKGSGQTVISSVYGGYVATAVLTVLQAGGGGTIDPGTPPDGNGSNGNGAPGTDGEGEPSVEEPEAIPFSDVYGHWALSDIKKAVKAGIANGYPDGTFRPDRPLARAEFLVMVSRAIPLPAAGSGRTKILSNQEVWPGWANDAIGQALAAGIATGYEDGSFRPEANITRAELIVLSHRLLVRKGWTLSEAKQQVSLDRFSDRSLIPAWAEEAFQALLNDGMLQGDERNRLNPQQPTTRAEALTLIFRLLEAKPE